MVGDVRCDVMVLFELEVFIVVRCCGGSFGVVVVVTDVVRLAVLITLKWQC